MKSWKWTAGLLCGVGLFKEFIPSSPFLLEYAVDYGNFTAEEFTHEILPVTTYGYLCSLLVLVFITDYLHYKPVIILGGLAAICTWAITIWSYDSLFHAGLRQVGAAIASSTDIAYLTYIYANVDKKHYKQVTSYTHSAAHFGKFLGAFIGQVLMSTGLLALNYINYFSLAGVAVYFVAACCLPKVKRASVLHPSRNSMISVSGKVNNLIKAGQKDKWWKKVIKVPQIFWKDFRVAYGHRYILRWSLWWSIAFALYLQIGMYAESLWDSIDDKAEKTNLNGAIDASHALLSACFGIVLPFVRLHWERWGEFYLSFISIIQGGIILWMSQTHHLYVCYGCYIIFQTLFQVVIIVTTAEVATCIEEDNEAFIFGINTLCALIIQTILTLVVTGEQGFELDIRDEFLVYGIYSFVLGGIFFVLASLNRNKHWDVDMASSEKPRNNLEMEENFGHVVIRRKMSNEF